ncbi:MAG: hypothetical protein ACK4PI_13250 [Tepidisphaerales bacterium]
MSLPPPDYLAPYIAAAKVHGGAFPTLLWASPATQQVRFEALLRLARFHGVKVLDVGCGRADLLDFLRSRGIEPAEYIGIEAVPELADAAARTGARVLRVDFVAEPRRLYMGCELLVISGSLNTAKDIAFYDTLRRAYDACGSAVVFNFLCDPTLAGAPHLYYRPLDVVLRYCRGFCRDVRHLADYLPGDATVGLFKSHP